MLWLRYRTVGWFIVIAHWSVTSLNTCLFFTIASRVIGMIRQWLKRSALEDRSGLNSYGSTTRQVPFGESLYPVFRVSLCAVKLGRGEMHSLLNSCISRLCCFGNEVFQSCAPRPRDATFLFLDVSPFRQFYLFAHKSILAGNVAPRCNFNLGEWRGIVIENDYFGVISTEKWLISLLYHIIWFSSPTCQNPPQQGDVMVWYVILPNRANFVARQRHKWIRI